VAGLFRKILDWYTGLGLEMRIGLVALIAIGTTAGGIAVIVRLPPDHFKQRPDPPSYTGWRRHRALRIGFLVLKNLLGLVMLPLGIIMSLPLVPGPGLVFMLLGLSLLNFPGKRKLERALIRRQSVTRVLTRMRARFGKPPFDLGPE
jgi:hypothetical protein